MAEWKGIPNYHLAPRAKMQPGECTLGFVTDDPRCFFFARNLTEAVAFAQKHTLTVATCRTRQELEELKIALGDAPAHS